MFDPTGTPAPALVADALRTLADLAATLYVRQPDGPTVVQVLSHETHERNVVLIAMTSVEATAEPTGHGILRTWRGWLAGWHLQLVQWVPAPAAAAALAAPDPTPLDLRTPYQCPRCTAYYLNPGARDACRCDELPPAELWWDLRCAFPGDHEHDHEMCRDALAELAERDEAGQRADEDEDLADSAERAQLAWLASLDTSPATAAAEQPAGLVSSWPLTVAADETTQPIPAPRPPAEMLPTPSWALIGLESTFAPLVTPGPLTDKALAGREQTAEVA